MKKLLSSQLDGLTHEIYMQVSEAVEKQTATSIKKASESKEYRAFKSLEDLIEKSQKAKEEAEKTFEEKYPDIEIRYGDLSLKSRRVDFDRVRKAVAFHTLQLKEDADFEEFVKLMVTKLTSK